jgi:sugar phosphate permease
MFIGANHSGLNVNLLELSPNYAGTLRGLVNTFYHIAAFLAPIISGFITQKYQSLWAWTTVFLLASGFFFLSGIIFILFGSSETQNWNNIDDDGQEEKDCKEKI